MPFRIAIVHENVNASRLTTTSVLGHSQIAFGLLLRCDAANMNHDLEKYSQVHVNL